jgi:hypothetical protein
MAYSSDLGQFGDALVGITAVIADYGFNVVTCEFVERSSGFLKIEGHLWMHSLQPAVDDDQGVTRDECLAGLMVKADVSRGVGYDNTAAYGSSSPSAITLSTLAKGRCSRDDLKRPPPRSSN